MTTPGSAKECYICYGKFNKTKNAPVTCFGCEAHGCRECLMRYLTDPSTTTPNCPTCHREWTRDFLMTWFTQKFVTTDLKHHREEVLFQREKSLLPLRQAEAEKRKKIADLSEEVSSINVLIAQLRDKQLDLQREINHLRYTDTDTTRREFVQPCPNDECRGFLSKQWKCGLCDKWSCKECHEVKGDRQDSEHACDPDKLASAKLIASETKPCPKCGARLFKISGCNQMWCTACNDCAFDWESGRIETTVHNPHYFEFQRRMNGTVPRQPGDIPCGGNVYTFHELNNVLRPYTRNGENPMNAELIARSRLLEEVSRYAVHINHVLIPRYRTDPIRFNEEHGIAYLQATITEEEFKIRLQRGDKKTQMGHDIINVLQMVHTTLNDAINRVGHGLMTSEPDKLSPYILAQQYVKIEMFYQTVQEPLKILDEVDPLLTYANECLARIAKVYLSKSPVVLKLFT